MILNITQHPATPEQIEAGVLDLADDAFALLKDLLNFSELPTRNQVEERAKKIAALAAIHANPTIHEKKCGTIHQAMIGGAPFLMGPLDAALRDQGIEPVYAFSRRESVEQTKEDGTVVKTSIFRHLGFV